MNKETIEALRQIEKEKSIPFDLLIEALGGRSPLRLPEDAARGAVLRSEDRPRYRGDPRVRADLPGRPGARDRGRGDRDRHLHGRARGDHARGFRPHRRADGQAGHLPAHPRGRAGHRLSRSTPTASARSSPASCSSPTAATPWSISAGWRLACPRASRCPPSATSTACA